MKVVQHQVDGVSIRVSDCFTLAVANSNADDLARGESSGDQFGFCGTRPLRGTASLVFVVMSRLASGRRGSERLHVT